MHYVVESDVRFSYKLISATEKEQSDSKTNEWPTRSIANTVL
jgi:hypothetical protein